MYATDESIKRVVEATIKVLQPKYGVRVNVKFTQGTHRCYSKTGQYEIVMGLQMLRGCMDNGSRHHPDARGWGAIVAISTHEFAHAVEYDIYGQEPGEDMHGEKFWDLWRNMITPTWTEVQALKVF